MNALANVSVGFAADDAGLGVAYVRVNGTRTLRIPFNVKRQPALSEREVGYAALGAVARALQKRGIDRPLLAISDEQLVADLLQRRDVPPALTLAYVRLRCALNLFKEFRIAAALPSESDLTARARGEMAMHVAA